MLGCSLHDLGIDSAALIANVVHELGCRTQERLRECTLKLLPTGIRIRNGQDSITVGAVDSVANQSTKRKSSAVTRVAGNTGVTYDSLCEETAPLN